MDASIGHKRKRDKQTILKLLVIEIIQEKQMIIDKEGDVFTVFFFFCNAFSALNQQRMFLALPLVGMSALVEKQIALQGS